MPPSFTNNSVDDALANYLTVELLEPWNQYRQEWEPRWAKSWRRLHNKYEKEFSGSEGTGWRSKYFYGMTRRKRRLAVSLMYDTVFQQARVPFGLDNTPITDSEDSAVDASLSISPEKKIKGMRTLIDDQLTEAKAFDKMRRGIMSGAGYGTGLIRGPIAATRIRNQWIPRVPEEAQAAMEQVYAEAAKQGTPEAMAAADDQVRQIIEENRTYELVQEEQIYPDLIWMDLWDGWLDPDSEDQADARGTFERRLLSNTEFGALAKAKGTDGKPIYDAKKIEEILQNSGTKGLYQFAEKEMNLSRGPHRERLTYEGFARNVSLMVWNGILPRHIVEEHLKNNDRDRKAIGERKLKDYEEIDCQVEFTRGKVVRFDVNQYPKRRRRIHVFRWAKVDGAPYGWGLADELENPQSAFNGFLRLLMDNKRLAAMGGVILRDGVIKNINEGLKPGVRYKCDKNYSPRDCMAEMRFTDVGGNILEVLKFIEQWSDADSSLPAFLEGDYIGSKAQTAYEASELKASAMKQLGIPIQNFDSDVVVPVIESFYDWNMMHHSDNEVKGDFVVHATGFASFKDKTIRGVELRNLLALKMQDPQQFRAINTDAILRELEKIGELPEGQFVFPEAVVEQLKQQEQQAQQAAIAQAKQIEQEKFAQQMALEQQRAAAAKALQDTKLKHDEEEADRDRGHDVEMTVLKDPGLLTGEPKQEQGKKGGSDAPK